MISPSSLIKRAGVGGRLVPFFKAVCVYFAVGGATPGAGAVAAKCAPVLTLLLLVLLHHGPGLHPEGRYARRIALGLALSALGDALLVWPQQLVGGMAAFGAAHAAYILAFRAPRAAPLAAAASYGAVAFFLTQLDPPGALRLLVPLYGALLGTMAWRAAAAGRPAAAAGAALFLVSDALLGYGLFGAGPVRHHQVGMPTGTGRVMVMSTYYLGQLGIALSALTAPARPAPAAALAPAPAH